MHSQIAKPCSVALGQAGKFQCEESSGRETGARSVFRLDASRVRNTQFVVRAVGHEHVFLYPGGVVSVENEDRQARPSRAEMVFERVELDWYLD